MKKLLVALCAIVLLGLSGCRSPMFGQQNPDCPPGKS